MTPPTFANLFRVVALWYPLGRQAGQWTAPLSVAWQTALGTASFLAPLAALGWSFLRPSRRPAAGDQRVLGLLAAGGIGIAAANILAVWGLARWGGMATFHGPRYTCLTAPLWGAGLAAAALLAARRQGWKSGAAFLPMAPWLLAGCLGFAVDAAAEKNAGMAPYLGDRGNFPAAGTPICVMPSELAPCYRRMLKDWPLFPVEALGEKTEQIANGQSRPGDEAYLLDLNNWMEYAPERDMELLALMKGGKLAASVEPHFMPPRPPAGTVEFFTLFRMKGIDAETLGALRARGFLSPPVEASSGALASVHPRDLARGDGWYALTIDGNGYSQRWSAGEEAVIRIPAPLPPGRYTIRLSGLEPALGARLQWRIGAKSEWKTETIAKGWFDLRLGFDLAQAEDRPALRLRHPLFGADGGNASEAARLRLGLLFHGLSLERDGQSSE